MDAVGLGSVADLVKVAVEKIWPDTTQQKKDELAAAVMAVQGQLAINQVEASSSSLFVSGWRPFIGWVCGSACAWNWIGLSLCKFGLTIWGSALAVSPALAPASMTEMMPVLSGSTNLH